MYVKRDHNVIIDDPTRTVTFADDTTGWDARIYQLVAILDAIEKYILFPSDTFEPFRLIN